jgi:hypothetical protein
MFGHQPPHADPRYLDQRPLVAAMGANTNTREILLKKQYRLRKEAGD